MRLGVIFLRNCVHRAKTLWYGTRKLAKKKERKCVYICVYVRKLVFKIATDLTVDRRRSAHTWLARNVDLSRVTDRGFSGVASHRILLLSLILMRTAKLHEPILVFLYITTRLYQCSRYIRLLISKLN